MLRGFPYGADRDGMDLAEPRAALAIVEYDTRGDWLAQDEATRRAAAVDRRL
jgi:hypothetical protein